MSAIGMIQPVSGLYSDRVRKRPINAVVKQTVSPCIFMILVNNRFVLMMLDPDHPFDQARFGELFSSDSVEIISEKKIRMIFPEMKCCLELLFRNDLPFLVYCSQKLFNQSSITLTDHENGFEYQMDMAQFIQLVGEKRLRLF